MSGNREGFVLLEAVAALMIVGVTSVSVLAALGTQMRAARSANDMIMADALARDRLARIELLNARELSFLPDSLSRGQFAAPLERYRWDAKTRAVANERGLFDVVISIQWDGGRSELATRLFRPATGVR